jgi:hypothetical protein
VDTLIDTNPSSTPAPLGPAIKPSGSAPKGQEGKPVDYKSPETKIATKRNQQRLAQANESDIAILALTSVSASGVPVP